MKTIKSLLVRLMEVVLTIRGKHDLFGFLAWEMTAYPMGSPHMEAGEA